MTSQKTENSLQELIARCRIKASARVIVRKPDEKVHQIIQAESQAADLVLMGLQSVAEGEEPAYLKRLQVLVGNLPTVILVRAGDEFAGQLL
ncbi:MAG: hypothetical protein AAFY88_31495 [Acidobacteriota bacterium]